MLEFTFLTCLTAEHGSEGSFSDRDGRTTRPYRSSTPRHVAMTLCTDDDGKPGTGLQFGLEGLQTLNIGVQKQRAPPPSWPSPTCPLNICSWSCLRVYWSNWFYWAASTGAAAINAAPFQISLWIPGPLIMGWTRSFCVICFYSHHK